MFFYIVVLYHHWTFIFTNITNTYCWIIMVNKSPCHILLLEPYYGGSHQSFLTGLQKHVECKFTLLTLPARKWKLRMQLAAPWFAERIMECISEGAEFDGILCSTFLDVAVLRSLLAGQGIHLPLSIYFHENQYSYPSQTPDPGYLQFTSINFTSALCADQLAFNSQYNLDTFLAGIARYLRKTKDMDLRHLTQAIADKSTVLYPGMDYADLDAGQGAEKGEGKEERSLAPVIVWNHRWEHDKDPETFFTTLFELAPHYDFRLLVLGQHFQQQPEIFRKARQVLADRIDHFGFAEDRSEYARLLRQGDIIISTARHEFFGIAVLEGVRSGCRPLLPDRLSYQELFAPEYRYQEQGKHSFKNRLRQLLNHPEPLSQTQVKELTQCYSWQEVASSYQRWLEALL